MHNTSQTLKQNKKNSLLQRKGLNHTIWKYLLSAKNIYKWTSARTTCYETRIYVAMAAVFKRGPFLITLIRNHSLELNVPLIVPHWTINYQTPFTAFPSALLQLLVVSRAGPFHTVRSGKFAWISCARWMQLLHNKCLVSTIMQYLVIDESDWSCQDLGVDTTSGTQAHRNLLWGRDWVMRLPSPARGLSWEPACSCYC